MKVFVSLFLLSMSITFGAFATPKFSGYELEVIKKFSSGIKVQVGTNEYYTAKKTSNSEIEVVTYNFNHVKTDANVIDMISNQDDYNDFVIIDFEFGKNGELVLIGQGNRSNQFKKQKCYLAHYIPKLGIEVQVIENSLYLYKELLFENGAFNFCAADGEVKLQGNRYSYNDVVRRSFQYDPLSKIMTSGFLTINSQETYRFEEPFVISNGTWLRVSRTIVTKHADKELQVNTEKGSLSFSEGSGTTYINAPGLHHVHLYDLAPFQSWCIAFSTYENGSPVSEMILANGDRIRFDEDELFQAIAMDPETGSRLIFTTQGIFTIKMDFASALQITEEKMGMQYSVWQKKRPLETESERSSRVDSQTPSFQDSILSVEMNKILGATGIEVFEGTKYQQEFKALRLKLNMSDDYFYTSNWSADKETGVPELEKLFLEYHYEKVAIVGFSYSMNGITYDAKRRLPPKILTESVTTEKTSPFEIRFDIEFTSKSPEHTVKVYVDDVPTDAELKALGNDRFKVIAPVVFKSYRAHLEMVVNCDLGESVFETSLECENFINSEGKDCFLAYHKETIVGFEKPSEMIQAMNVCIIVANSNFSQTDTTKQQEVPMAENALHAAELKEILTKYYNFKEEHVTILEDQTKDEMEELFRQLKKIDLSEYYSQSGVSKINLTLVVLSHGSMDNYLVTSDGQEFDIADAVLDLNKLERFEKYVQDFLYIEDICYGSFSKDRTTRGHLINVNTEHNFCRYATKQTKVGVMSSLNGNKVQAYAFIKGLNKALRENKDARVLTLEDLFIKMSDANYIEGVPLLINLKPSIGETKAQKSIYLYTEKYLQEKDEKSKN